MTNSTAESELTEYRKQAWREAMLTASVPLFALSLAFLSGLAILALMGYDAMALPGRMAARIFTDAYGAAQVLRMTTLLALAGLAVALAFRSGLFNIGVEGQALMAGLAIATTAHYVVPSWQAEGWARNALPGWGWSIVFMLVGMLAGALYAGLAGLLKAWRGAHEVITTILMNFIAYAAINYSLRPEAGSLAARGATRTLRLPSDFRLPRASETFPTIVGSNLNLGTLVGFMAIVLVGVWLARSRSGYETRVVGLNPEAARWAGIWPGWVIFRTMALSGALAGLIAYETICGAQGWMEEGFTAGVGFAGIAVAMVAATRPLWIIPAAFLFACLSYGRVAVGGDVPKDIVDVIQAIAILAVAVGGAYVLRMQGRSNG